MRRKYWKSYVREIANLLDLRDWDIRLSDGVPRDGAIAGISCVVGRKIAWISLCSDFESQSSEVQRHAVVHELLHIHINGMSRVLDLLMESRLEGWLHAAQKPFVEALEYSTDGIATAIARYFPIPEAKKAK